MNDAAYVLLSTALGAGVGAGVGAAAAGKGRRSHGAGVGAAILAGVEFGSSVVVVMLNRNNAAALPSPRQQALMGRGAK